MAAYTKIIYLGSSTAGRQMGWGIPSGRASGQPGVLVLPTGATTPTEYKLFVDTGGNLRITSGTTFADSDGTAFASGAGANTALSNLVAVAINTSLVSDAVNTDDLGSDALPWRSAYVRTSLIFDQTTRNLTITASEPATLARTVNFGDPGANDGVVYLAAAQDLTTKTYNGLTLAGATNAISITQGTASIVLAAGNTDITLGAAAQINITAAKTLSIVTDLTVNTVAVTLNQALATTSSPTFVTITGTTFTDGTATLTAGALSGVTTIGTTGAITCRGITNTIAAINSTLAINIGADNVNLTLGAGGAASSRIYYDGDDLILWDSKVGAYTLQQLATGSTLNPSVTGNLTILDGNFTWGNAATDETAVWTLAATTVDGIQIVSANTTADVVQITGNATAGGNLLHLISVDATMTTGAYIRCYDGGAEDFAVRRYGATTIAGSAALTAALTLTTGDIVVTNGQFTCASTADVSNKISRNSATGATPVLEIEETNAAGDVVLLIDSKHTGAVDGAQITYLGTGSALKITNATSTTGTALTAVTTTLATTKLVYLDGTTTDGWIGAANVGMLHIASDGALADVDASLLYSTYTGTIAAAATMKGTCGYFKDGGAASGSTAAVYITSTANHCLNIASVAVGKSGLLIAGPDAQTASMVVLDGTGAAAGWGGAANVGMLHLKLDGATLATTASALQIVIGTGQPTDSSLGYALKIADTTAAAATNPHLTYAAYINALANSGMAIVTTAATTRNLVLTGGTGQTASILVVDGSTGSWTGAENVGALHITSDGTAAHVSSSLLYIGRSGTGLAANLGSSLRINDSTTAGAGTYVAYLTSASNSVLNLVTAAVAKSALVITGPASQTASAVTIGGAAIGWIGGPAVGMLQLDSNGALVANASLLLATNATQPAVANDGICAEFVDTGNAQATSYAVRIASTNNEALHVDTGLAVFDEGPKVQYSASAATDNAPTQAEMNTAFGITAATAYNGFVGVLNDTTNAGDDYICFVSSDVWFFLKGTQGA